jgi:hypothetical protein
MSRLPTLRRAAVSLAVVGVLAFGAPNALADGNGAFTDTQNFHNVTETFPADAMCGSPVGTVTVTYNGVFHITVNKAGDVWVTGTQAGTFVLVPDDVTMPTFAGHFAIWFGLSDNNRNSVEHSTFNARGTATDGSGATVDIHAVAHVSVSASGQVNTFFACH